MNSEITIKLGRETETVRDASLAKEIHEACRLDAEARAVTAKLGEIKKRILENAKLRIPEDTDYPDSPNKLLIFYLGIVATTRQTHKKLA